MMYTVFTARTTHGTVLAMHAGSRRVCHIFPDQLGAEMITLHLLTGGELGTRCLPFTADGSANRIVLPREISPGSGILLHALAGDEPNRLRSAASHLYLSAIPDGNVEANRAHPALWEEFDVGRDESFDGLPPSALKPFLDDAKMLFGVTERFTDGLARLLAAPPSDLLLSLIETVWPLLTLEELDEFAGQLGHDRALASRLTSMLRGDFYAVTVLPALLQWLAVRKRQPAAAVPGSGGDAWPPRPAAVPSSWRWHEAAPATANPATANPATAAPNAPLPPSLIGPELDHLARDGYDGWLSSLAHACNASLRARVTAEKGVAIVATARSEGIYLLEWIAHHRLLGVEAIYLYTNNNDDGSDALLAALHAAGVITWTRSELSAGVSAQNKAYGHALNVSMSLLDHRWALFIDLDEFLVLNPDRYRTIADFARWHGMRQTDAVGMNWVMAGSSGQSRWTDAPLARRNTHLINTPNRHIKTMVRPQRFIQAHPHFPFADRRRSFTFRLANGEMHAHRKQPAEAYHAQAFTDEPDERDACVYHFYFKSLDEFVWKSSRNRGDFPFDPGTTFQHMDAVSISAFLEQHRSDDVRHSGIASRSEMLLAEIGRLQSLPGVGEAERLIVGQFRARLSSVKQQLLQSGRLDSLGGPGHELKRMLLETMS